MDIYAPQVLFIIIGVLVVCMSIFLGVTKNTNIIELHDDYKAYDEEKLLKWMIKCFAFAGAGIILTSILAIFYPFINAAISFAVIVCIMALLIGIGCSKYEI